MQAAKDLSTKSDKEKKAILGAAAVINTDDNNEYECSNEYKHKKKHKKEKKSKNEKDKNRHNDKDNYNDNDHDDDKINWDLPLSRPRTRSMSSVSNADETGTDLIITIADNDNIDINNIIEKKRKKSLHDDNNHNNDNIRKEKKKKKSNVFD